MLMIMFLCKKLNQNFLNSYYLIKFTDNLNDYERASVADALEEISFEVNEEIIRQGDQGDFFYIIIEVCVVVHTFQLS